MAIERLGILGAGVMGSEIATAAALAGRHAVASDHTGTTDAAAVAEVGDRDHGGAVDEALRCRDEGVARVRDIETAMRLEAGWEMGPRTWAGHAGDAA